MSKVDAARAVEVKAELSTRFHLCTSVNKNIATKMAFLLAGKITLAGRGRIVFFLPVMRTTVLNDDMTMKHIKCDSQISNSMADICLFSLYSL